MKMKRILILLLVLSLVLAIPAVAFAESDANIADSKLKNALRSMLGKGATEQMKPSELATLTGEIDLSNLGITNTIGIEYLVGATKINLSGNAIEHMSSKIKLLTTLESLDLSVNAEGRSLPLAVTEMIYLKELNLAANEYTSLPSQIRNMTSLETLNVSANRLAGFPDVLFDMNLVNLNVDYNFLDLREGKVDREDIDKMSTNVSGEYLAFRQFQKLESLTYYPYGGKIVVEWDGIDDIAFYDGTTASVRSYAVLVIHNGALKYYGYGPAKRSMQIDAVPGDTYEIRVSPDYRLAQYGDFDIRSYYHVKNVKLGNTGATLGKNADPVLYPNSYPTPTPVPTPTPTPIPTPTPEATPVAVQAEGVAEVTADGPSPAPTLAPAGIIAGMLGTPLLLTMIMLVVILVLILVVTVLLVVLVKNKSVKGKDE